MGTGSRCKGQEGHNFSFYSPGWAAERLMKYGADDQLQRVEHLDKLNDKEKEVKMFDRIKGKTMVFKLMITDYNVKYQSDNFTVMKIFKNEVETKQGSFKSMDKMQGTELTQCWVLLETRDYR
ncbi:hypothetical protein C5167_026866 [Papaver somniferum]|nr:hypothetical protein C5167_026866 [Papaver somniferum]